jgi:hypothetical protein
MTTFKRRYIQILLATTLLLISGLACNLLNQPAAVPTPTTNPANTLPPTRTLLPTGAIPTPLPGFQASPVVIQPTSGGVAIQPTAVILPTTVPFVTATPFPTRIPTSTSLPITDIAIYSPVDNNVLAGIVQVIGSAAHPFFVQYQLEFSPDPGELWALVPGSISAIQLQNGLLGLWDTRQTPDGIYQLRLRVFTQDGGSTVTVVRNIRVSNQTATPPPSPTNTPTVTPTFTPTIIPTSTPIPTETPVPTEFPTLEATFTPLPTEIPTDVPAPTEEPTQEPTFTPLPTDEVVVPPPATDTPEPTTIPTEGPPLADLNAIPVVPVLSPATITNLRGVFENGVNNFGNTPYAFAQAGDENTAAAQFLNSFGTAAYNLDVYAGLQTAIDFFGVEINGNGYTSFTASSRAASPGWSSIDLLEPGQADPTICVAGESPLQCEIRLLRPSMVLIMIGTYDTAIFANSPETFRANLQVIVNTAISNGVIPVLSTIPERLDDTVTAEQVARINTEIVNVATSADIPLWNFWAAVRDLPNQGISGDGLTLSLPPAGVSPADLSPSGLTYGFNQRNLSALQVIDTIRQNIYPEVPAPAAPQPEEPADEPTVVAVVPTNTPEPLPTSTELPTETPIPTEIPNGSTAAN